MHGTPHVNFVFDAPQRQRPDARTDFSDALQNAQAAMMSSLLASSGHGGAQHDHDERGRRHHGDDAGSVHDPGTLATRPRGLRFGP